MMGEGMPVANASETHRAGWKTVMLAWLWIAVAAGAIEPVLLLVRKAWLAKPMAVNAHVVWMAPVAYGIYLFPVVVTSLILMRLFPKRVSPRGVVSVLSFVAAFSLAVAFRKYLHWIPIVVVSLGISARVTQTAGRSAAQLASFARRTLPWMIAVVALATVVTVGWRSWRERAALAALQELSGASPSVLILILDTVRAMNLSLYGYDRPTTPRLDEFAGRGTVFEQAMATSSWTLPSHASMFTGQYHYRLSTTWRAPLDDTFPTLAEVLRDRGYNTGAFVANMAYTHWETGIQRGFIRYRDYPNTIGHVLRNASISALLLERRFLARFGIDALPGSKTAESVNRQFLNWIDQNGDRPYFAFLNYFDAHKPYASPREFRDEFDRVQRHLTFWQKVGLTLHLIDDNRAAEEREQEWRTRRIDRYDAAISYVDHHIGALLDTLERRGTLNNTIVVVVSDHGESHGDHGTEGHGRRLYVEETHVPLMVLYPPRVPRALRIPNPVAMRSVPATVMDLLDASSDFPGASLARLWGEGEASEPDLVLSELASSSGQPIGRGALRSVVIDSLHYIWHAEDGREELYDLAADPLENSNLLSDGAVLDLRRFRAALADHPWPAIEPGPAATALQGTGAKRLVGRIRP